MPPIENATYVTELNESWPLGSDNLSEGDDHDRLKKSVLKNSFGTVNQNILKADGTEDPANTDQQYFWTPNAIDQFARANINDWYNPSVLGSSFTVEKTANQLFNSGVVEKVTWDQEAWDDAGFDLANNEHNPQVAGTYQYACALSIDPNGNSPRRQVILEIRKNDSMVRQFILLHPGGGEYSQISTGPVLVQMNGSSDTVSVYFRHEIAGTEQVVGDPTRSFFQGIQVSQ